MFTLTLAADKLISLLDEYLPLVRWDDWYKREILTRELKTELSYASEVKEHRDYGLRDLLNAAWLVRFDQGVEGDLDFFDRLTRNVASLVDHLMAPAAADNLKPVRTPRSRRPKAPFQEKDVT